MFTIDFALLIWAARSIERVKVGAPGRAAKARMTHELAQMG